MPDLTAERYAACEPYAEWCLTPARASKIMQLPRPACTYYEYNDAIPPKDGKCPKCGGRVVHIKEMV